MTAPGTSDQGQRFALTPAPPLRALAIGSTAAVVGALLVVLAEVLSLPLVLTVIGAALLLFAVFLVVCALALTARLRTGLVLDRTAVHVTHGRHTRSMAWSEIDTVGLRGPRLSFTPKPTGPVLSVVNPRSPADPTFLALVAAIRQRLDDDRGYRPLD